MLLTSSVNYQTNQEKQLKVKQYENKIDQMVYELYGLIAEEIATIEGSAK